MARPSLARDTIFLLIAIALSVIKHHTTEAFSSSSSRSGRFSASPVHIDVSTLGPIDIKKATELIKANVLLSEVIGQYVPLKPSGSRQFQCKCLFHKDNNPSMGVSDDKGVFNCFSCGAKGDVIQFVMDVEQLSFTDTVKRIVIMADLDTSDLQETQRSEEEQRYIRARTRQEALLRAASDYYMSCLHDPRGGAARRHLMGRRIRPETSFKFGIGYAPPSINGAAGLIANLTGDGRFTLQEVIGSGLAIDSDQYADRFEADRMRAIYNRSGTSYDRFRERLMVPIRNPQGAVIAFGGRVLDGSTGVGAASSSSSSSSKGPKYLNSPESQIFKKGSTLFGLDVARRAVGSAMQAVLVEGYFDVISMHDVGVEIAVGTLGTAVTLAHLQAAHRASKGGTLVLMMDSDDAGQTAVERCCLQVLSQPDAADFDVRVASLSAAGEGVKDPSDLCAGRSREAAAEAVREIIAAAVGWKQWIAERLICRGARSRGGVEEACAALRADTAALARVLRSLAQFVASLPEASDRTLLTFFCAEKIAGPSAAMKAQLEFDLATTVRKEVSLATTGRPSGGGKARIFFPEMPPLSPPQQQQQQSSAISTAATGASAQRPMPNPLRPPGAVSSSAPISGRSGGPTEAFARQPTPGARPPARQQRIEATTADSQAAARFPALSEQQPEATAADKEEQVGAATAGGGSGEEDEEAEDPSVDVATIKNSPSPPQTLGEQERRKKFRPQFDVLWEQSALRDEVLSFGTPSTRGREVESEAVLLSIYCHCPSLRNATRSALEQFTTDSGDGNDDTARDISIIWSERSHLMLWELITEVEAKAGTAEVGLIEAIETLSDKEHFQAYLASVADILSGAAIAGKEPLALEFTLRDAALLVAAASTRRRQVDMLRVRVRGGAEGAREQAEALEQLAAGISTQGGNRLGLGDEFEIALSRQQLQSKLDMIARVRVEGGPGTSQDDVEMLYWLRGSDTSDQEAEAAEKAAAQGGDKQISSNNKYAFDFIDSSAILADGEMSAEEERLKSIYTQGASRPGAGGVSGVTFGLDDIYEDSYGREARAQRAPSPPPRVPSKRDVVAGRRDAYRRAEDAAPFGGSLDGLRRGGRAEQWRVEQAREGEGEQTEIGEIEHLTEAEEEEEIGDRG